MKKTIYAFDLTRRNNSFEVGVFRAIGTEYFSTSSWKYYRPVTIASSQRVSRLMSRVMNGNVCAWDGGMSVLSIVKNEFRK